MKLASFFVIVLATVVPAFSQTRTKQLDEFGRITCEDLLARTEYLVQRLQAAPATSAVVVTYNPDKSIAWQHVFMHRVVIGYLGNGSSVQFFETSDRGVTRTEIWLAPAGTIDTRAFRPTLSIPYVPTGRMKWSSESGDPCSGHVFPGFLEMLKTTDFDGRIVFVNYSRSDRLFSIGEYRKDLKKHGIAPNRIRFRYRTVRTRGRSSWPYVDFLLNPKKTS